MKGHSHLILNNYELSLYDMLSTLNEKGVHQRYAKFILTKVHTFFISNAIKCCLTFSWIELQMLLSCCLIPISILREFLYLLYLCPCLDLGLFTLRLCDLLFIFITVNRAIPWIKRQLCFACFLECVLLFLDDNVDEEYEWFSNS